MSLELLPHWRAAWRDLQLSLPAPDVLQSLLAAWDEPQRRYHTRQHLGECLELLAADRALAERPGEVALALWFHDAVYDPERHDNEAASARWAREVLRGAGALPAVVDRVGTLIMATCHQERPQGGDAMLLVDIDLAILGAGLSRFDQYERQIRDEYAFVPEPVFRDRRAAVLRGFLELPALFATPQYAARFDAAARANLARALTRVA